MTDQSTHDGPLKPGEGKGGCVGLGAGLVGLALVSFVLAGVGYLVAHLLGWV